MSAVAILHYAGPPYVGGVEITMAAHGRALSALGWSVRIIAGKGGDAGPGVDVRVLPDLDSRGDVVERVNRELAAGIVSAEFLALCDRLAAWLDDALAGCDALMVHNVLSLHKNLAFTAALRRLHDAGRLPPILAWCHDFAWHDPLYLPELHPGYPWDLLREAWPGVRYVVVSEDRRGILAGLLGLAPEQIAVVTPGVDVQGLLKLEPETAALVERLGLLEAAPLLLLPARITRRKNIELAVAIAGAMRHQGAEPRLVVTGPPGPHNPTNAAYLDGLLALRRDTGAEGSTVFLYEVFTDPQGQPRPVSDAMVADFFHLADGLLFPSRYEGFGIPVLEAGLSGIPIFCSDIPPLRASAGPAALYFGLEERPDRIAERILTALAADHRYLLRRRVRTTYTWEAIVRRHIVPLLAGA